MSEWPTVRFGDLFQIKHGFAFKGEHFSDEPGPVVLTPGNFEARGGLKLRPGKDRSYDGEFPEAFKLKVGELLVVMTDLTQEAAILGAPAFVLSDIACLHNQRLGKIVDLKADRLDLRFLYYLCNTHDYREYLRSTATGSTVKHTSPGRICDFAVSLPPIETQRRIAGILGAYDDLIEVNQRRIAVLKEMAQALFTEWFTHLRFPGHEDVAIEDTPDGPLPAGWSLVQLGALIELIYGKALKADTRQPGDVAVIGSSGVVGSHNAALVSGPGIVVGRKGNVGSVIWSSSDYWPIDTTYYVDTKLPLPYIYQLLKRITFQNTDAAVPGLNRDYALSRMVLTAPDALVQRYGDFAAPIHDAVTGLEQANANIAAARDLLLPRLISGQLSVTRAEQELEAA